MRLQSRLTVVFLILFIFCLGAMGFLSFQLSRQALREKVFHHVEHISKDLADRIDSFFFERLISINSIATSEYLKSRLDKINRKSEEPEQLCQQMCRRLEQLKKSDIYISELFILNPQGVIVASTDKNQIGKDKSGRDYFKQGRVQITDMYISATLNRPTMVATAPLMDAPGADCLGMVVARLDIEDFGRVIRRSIGWIKGEEVYVLNKDGFFLTGFISKKLFPLSDKLHSGGIDDCLTKQRSIFSVYPNYMGRTVIGACRYVKNKHWVLVVEIEIKEAFKAIYNLRNWFLRIGVIIAVIIIGFTIKLARQIAYPIRKLTTASDEIAAGNLNVSVDVKTGDEIELLADSFNRMVKDLKQYRGRLTEWTETLEQEVRVKTAELREKVRELEEFAKLSVGRELKMMELEKKLKELEGK